VTGALGDEAVDDWGSVLDEIGLARLERGDGLLLAEVANERDTIPKCTIGGPP
jgi:hypothetical protein